MAKQLQKIDSKYFNQHGNVKLKEAMVVHAMGGSILMSTINDLVQAVQELQVQVTDDEVLVNGKRYKLIKESK